MKPQPPNTRSDGYGNWRKIAPEERKPVECWVNVYEDGDLVAHRSVEAAFRDSVFARFPGRTVHMIEASEVERRVRARIQKTADRIQGFKVALNSKDDRDLIEGLEYALSEISLTLAHLSDDEGEP